MNTDIRELSVDELEHVTGGFMFCFGAFAPVPPVKSGGGGGGGGDGGGQNDPAQMFQQIMQQLTQGQG